MEEFRWAMNRREAERDGKDGGESEDSESSDSDDEDTRKHLGNRKSKLIKKVDIAGAFMLQMSLTADGDDGKACTFDNSDDVTLLNASELHEQQQVSSPPFITGAYINRVVEVAFQWPNRQYKPQIATPCHNGTFFIEAEKNDGSEVLSRGFKVIHPDHLEKSESDSDGEC